MRTKVEIQTIEIEVEGMGTYLVQMVVNSIDRSSRNQHLNIMGKMA
jgi:hypothetical protein